METGASGSRETLFLKLAIRNGIFSQEDAKKLLDYYREAAPRGKRIETFLVEEGYLEAEVAKKLAQAIAARDHAPQTEARAGAGPARTASSRLARRDKAQKVQASPAQVTMIALGLIVTIGAVVFLGAQLTGGSKSAKDSITDAQKENEEELRRSAAERANAKNEDDDSSANLAPAAFTDDQLKGFAAMVQNAAKDANFELVGDDYKGALSVIDSTIENLKAQAAPKKFLDELTAKRAEFQTTYSEALKKMKASFESAKSAGDEEKMDTIREQIRRGFGEEEAAKL